MHPGHGSEPDDNNRATKRLREHPGKRRAPTLHINLNKTMMLKKSYAGTLESGDILIQLSPSEKPGLSVNLDSTVGARFGKQITSVIEETLRSLGVEDAIVDATDKGALDCTIRARTTAAAVRATGKDVWQ